MPGITDVTLVQELGQPSLSIKIDRAKIARYGVNVDDINGLIETAIGGDRRHPGGAGREGVRSGGAAGPQYRDNPEEIGNIPVATPGGQQIPLKELADISVTNGASFIYREAIPAISACSSRSRAAIWPARWATPSARSSGK